MYFLHPRRPAIRKAAVALATLAGSAALISSGMTPAQAAAGDQVVVNLLDINDFHGRIDSNTVKFAGTVEQLRSASGDANTLFLSAGDNIGASLFASASQQDKPTIDVLNALDLKASAIGNHELDQGVSDLSGRVQDAADYDYLAANIYDKGTENPVFDEYKTYDLAGVSVAVIGAITEEAPALVTPTGIANVDFGDPVDAVNRVAGELEAVTGAEVWNINAYESVAREYSRFDYNVLDFYNESQFRSSDHDPIVIGIDRKTLRP